MFWSVAVTGLLEGGGLRHRGQSSKVWGRSSKVEILMVVLHINYLKFSIPRKNFVADNFPRIPSFL